MTQTTLNGSDIVSTAISRLREHEPNGGYRLAFSGGKDSIVCYHLAELAGVKFEAHYAMTTIDPPEVLRFIREQYPDVIWDKPMYKKERTNFYELVSLKGLPNRQVRWCCSILKEASGKKGETTILGVRRAESLKRSKRDVFCMYDGRFQLNPIVDWTDTDVWDYIRLNELSYPSIYDEGQKRVGCVMCPLACRSRRARDYERYPKHVKALERAVDKYLETHPNTTITEWGGSGRDIVYRWVHESPIESAKGQCLGNFQGVGVE